MRRPILLAATLLALLPAGASAAPALTGTFPVSDVPGHLALGGDGGVWFTVGGTKELGRITPAGAVTEYDNPGGQDLAGVVRGDGATLWFAYAGGLLEWDATTATGTNHALPALDAPSDITRDRAGRFWITDTADGSLVVANADGTPNRSVTFGGAASGRDIELGADGRLWWVDFGAAAVRATPADAVDATTTQTIAVGGNPQGLATSPGGAVAYTNPAPPHRVGLLPVSGAPVTDVPTGAGTDPFGAAFGADGAFWFAAFAADQAIRVTTAGASTALPLPAGSGPRRIATGAGGTLWVSLETSHAIARISGVDAPQPTTPPQPPAAPQPPLAEPPAATPAPPAGDRRPPRITGLGVRRLGLRLRVSERVTVVVRVERRAGRRWRHAVTVRRTLAPGRRTITLARRLPGGRYRVIVSARDAAGNRTRRTLRFRR